jgi:isopentenyl phosphate kinase
VSGTQPLALVKLGGSIVTVDRPGDPVNRELLARLGPELLSAATPLILVHGTGHVGKPWAHKGGFATSGFLAPSARDVALRIKADLRDLNARIVSCLLDAGVPALGLEFESLAAFNPMQMRAFLRARLAVGAVPVFFGDMVLEPDGGHRVVSSDAMMLYFATILGARTALFLTDVAGVLGGEPEAPLESISPATADRAARRASDDQDVSAGMRGKLASAFAVAARVERCFIADGRDPSIAARLLRDAPAPATRVLPAP